MFTAPQAQVQAAGAGLGEPHSGQNFPVFTLPQAQVQVCPAGPFWPPPALGPAPGIPPWKFPAFWPYIPFLPWFIISICLVLAAEAAPMKLPPLCIPIPMPMNPARLPLGLEPAAFKPSAICPWTYPSRMDGSLNMAPRFLKLISFWDSSS